MSPKRRKRKLNETQREKDTSQDGIQSSIKPAGKNSDPTELRIVLIGGRDEVKRSGKSSVGNIILGKDVFDTNRRTTKSVMRQQEVSGRQVTVVDTPGWWSYHPLDLTPKLTQLEIQQSVNLCPPGPHAFVLVMPLVIPCVGTVMSAEEHVNLLLSDRVWKHTTVVFTVADRNNMRPDLIRSNHQLRSLIEKCEGRFHVLNIRDRGDRSQVTELLEKIDQMVTSNGGHYETEEHVSEELKEKETTIRTRAEQRRTDGQKQTPGLPKHIGLTDLRIVLLGRWWSGKSSAGNTILTGRVFKAGQRSVQCEVRQGQVAGRQVTVVDSPGWWYNSPLQDTSEMDKLEIQNSVSFCCPGPHSVLLTVPLDKAFTKADRVAVEEHMTLLSPSVWSHAIVLFTFGDCLGDRSIEQHIEAEGEDLRWLVDKCGNRFHVFNNQQRDDTQVKELLEKMEEMVAGNRGGHYEDDGDVSLKISERKRDIEEHVLTFMSKTKKQRSELKALLEGEHLDLLDVRLMLVGGEQLDRNRAGNRILPQTVFTETQYKEFKSLTKLTQCVREQRRVADRNVSVVICPDWSTTPPSQKTKDVLLHGVTLCSPGPHAVLVTVNVRSSFSEADRRSVEEHMELLGDRVWRDTLVLFIWGWWLGGRRVEEYIESEGEPLRWILEKCGFRYHVLDGHKWDISEATELLVKVEDMVMMNRRPIGPSASREDRSVRDTGHLKDKCYPVTHNPRGTCLIINNEKFTVDDLRERRGTLEDEKALDRVFSKLGFEVKVHRDLTADDIRRVLKELGGQRFMKADVLVVCILSHGEMGGVFGTDGVMVSLKELTRPFTGDRAPTLAGKPKLFFIQACQGSDVQKGVMPPTPSEVEGDDWSHIEEDASAVTGQSIPWGADFLIGMATVEECKSFRSITTGSFYIQELCKQLETAAVSGDDIHSVLTDVNREVSRGEYLNSKQMPECRNTLTKKLILNFIDQ